MNQDFDTHKQDAIAFDKHMPLDVVFDRDDEKATMDIVEKEIRIAATTKLEFRVVKQILENQNNASDAKSKMHSAEMSYAKTHRLRYQDNVHEAVLRMRAMLLKKANKKPSDEDSAD